jgi:hypothetical protein
MERPKIHTRNLTAKELLAYTVWGLPANPSRYVESLIVRVPFPSLYIHNGVILNDRSFAPIKAFMLGKFTLSGMEFLLDLEGKDWYNLPRNWKRLVEESVFTCHDVWEEVIMERIYEML